MKVLLISASPINKTTSIGNTFLNIMPQEFELASIYTRAGAPDNRIKKAFTISEKRLVRFKKGVLVEKRYNEGVNGSSDGLETFARKHRFSVFFLLRELLWSVFGLKNKGIDEFVREFDPDIIFTVSTNQIHLNRIIEYVTEVSKKPLAVYAWDNNYFDNPYEKSFLKKKLHKREKLYMRRVINKAEKVFVISEKQKVDYDSEFGIDSAVLTKYESFDKPFEYCASSGVLKFVYTGNLGVGRWQTVAKLVSALCKINADGIKAQLDIYSSTPLTEEMKKPIRTVYLTPQGRTFTQKDAQSLAEEEDLILLCGHYEGIDERVLETICTDYISIGDYVLTGGELPAMVLVDAVSRLVPGVLHNDVSADTESFEGNLLEYPQYSRPEEWQGKKVPQVLLSGDHRKIDEWRRIQSMIRTRDRRPDLLERAELVKHDRKLIDRVDISEEDRISLRKVLQDHLNSDKM